MLTGAETLPTDRMGLLRAIHSLQRPKAKRAEKFRTGLGVLDELMPNGAWEWGSIHEILAGLEGCVPWSFAALLAGAATKERGAVVWCDSGGEMYPPTLISSGIAPDRLLLLRAKSSADELWAVTECLRCKGVAATVAVIPRLSGIEARRLQLAAERGGGVGILIRPSAAATTHYAAATRWLIQPAVGTAAAQRWEVQLVHGHGGQVGKKVWVEVCRDSNHVRAIEAMAHRPTQTQAARATA